MIPSSASGLAKFRINTAPFLLFYYFFCIIYFFLFGAKVPGNGKDSEVKSLRVWGSAPDPDGAPPHTLTFFLQLFFRFWGSAPDPVGAPPQTPELLRRKNVAGGSVPRPPLGPRPRPRWGSSPNPVQEGSGGWSPQRGSAAEPQPVSGGGVPSNILAAKPARGLGRSPNRRGPLPPPPLATPL